VKPELIISVQHIALGGSGIDIGEGEASTSKGLGNSNSYSNSKGYSNNKSNTYSRKTNIERQISIFAM